MLADLAAAAEDSRSPLNVVILGVLAGLKALPITADTFRATIRAEGKAVEANLRGFEAGLAVANSPSPRLRGEGRGEGQPRTPAQALPLTLALSP